MTKVAPIESLLNGVEWSPIPGAGGEDLHATHEGVLEIGGVSLRCYVLSDGSRVFDADDVERVFGGDGPLERLFRRGDQT